MLRAGVNKVYKILRKTAGVERGAAARKVATHLISHNCGITQAIVAELFSFEEMVQVEDKEFDRVVKQIEWKMKST